MIQVLLGRHAWISLDPKKVEGQSLGIQIYFFLSFQFLKYGQNF